MIVLDASAAVELVLAREPVAAQVKDALSGQEVRVPAHFDLEVFSGVRRSLRRRTIDTTLAEAALFETARLLAERVPLTSLLADAYAFRDAFSPGDVFYVVLARRSGALLLTSDAPLSRAAAAHVEVRLVGPLGSPSDAEPGSGTPEG